MPIETGRWLNIELSNRKCKFCDKDTIGDEFHYLLECTFSKKIENGLFLCIISGGEI